MASAPGSYGALFRSALHAFRCPGQAARWQAGPQYRAASQPAQAFTISSNSEAPALFVHLHEDTLHHWNLL